MVAKLSLLLYLLVLSCHWSFTVSEFSFLPWQRQKSEPTPSKTETMLAELLKHIKSQQDNAFSLTKSERNEPSASPTSRKSLSEASLQLGVRILGDVVSAAIFLVKIEVALYIAKRSIKQISEVAKKIMEVALNRSNNMDMEIQSLLKPNVTLNGQESEIASHILLPSGIAEEWGDIGGMSRMQDALLDLVEYSEDKQGGKSFSFNGVKSVLLFGPPGCGKSLLIRCLAKKLSLPLIRITPSTLLRKYVGESSQLLQGLFTLLRKIERPVIVCVDELDALFMRRRSDEHSPLDRQLKTEFMQLWDESALDPSCQALVITATNRPQDLDPAVQRRFDRSFLLDLPDFESRAALFEKMLSFEGEKEGTGGSDLPPGSALNVLVKVDFSRCASLTEGYSSSDVHNVCKAAKQMLAKEMKKLLAQQVDPENGRKKGDETIKAVNYTRELTTQDMEDILLTYYPTSWTSKAYAQQQSQRTSMPPSPYSSFDPYNPDCYPLGDAEDEEDDFDDLGE